MFRTNFAQNRYFLSLLEIFSDIVMCSLPLQNGLSLLIVCIYRPPNISGELNNKLIEIIYSCSANFTKIVIIGDFNYPEIKWSNLSYPSACADFVNCISDCGLFQHVDFPTRYNNILDLIFSSDQGLIGQLWSTDFPGCDHKLIWFELNFFNWKNCVKNTLSWSRCD